MTVIRSPLYSPLRSPLRSPLALLKGGGVAAPAIVLSATSIAEGPDIGRVVAALSVINLPDGVTVTGYTLTADPDDMFDISTDDLITTAALDYEAATSHAYTIEAALSEGGPVTRSGVIAVTNVFEEPDLVALTLDADEIVGGSEDGTVVGAVVGQTSGSTLSLIDDAGGRFALDGTDIVAGATATDYDTATSHSITIRETLADSSNSPRDSVIAVTVTSALVAPVITGSVAISGDAIEGQTLTAAAPSYTGSGAETWQWVRDGSPISGATSITYLIVEDDVGASLAAQFTVTNDAGADDATSAGTDAVEDVILNAFASGLDGFWLDAAAPSRLYQALGGFNVSTIATAYTAGNTVGVALDQHLPIYDGAAVSLASVLALQTNLVLNGDLSTNDLTDWTVTTTGTGAADASTGAMILTGTAAAGGNRALVSQSQSVTAGDFYYGAADVVITSGAMQQIFGTVPGAADHFGSNAAATRTHEAIFAAKGSTNYASFGTQADGSVISADNVVLKHLPGNHSSQATAGSRPTYQSGPVLRSVLDDNLLTKYVGAAANTLFYLGLFNAASDVALGSKGASDGRLFLGTDASGRIAGGVGTDSTSTIHGSADIRGVRDCYALRNDGSTVDLWEGLSNVYSAAQAGAPTTAVPLRVMALNDNGTGASFLDGDGTVWLAFADALADWQVTAIIKKLRSRI